MKKDDRRCDQQGIAHSVVLINSNILEPKCERIPVPTEAEVSKHVVYTIDTQNSILFIHASIEHMDTKIKDTVLFTISQKNT